MISREREAAAYSAHFASAHVAPRVSAPDSQRSPGSVLGDVARRYNVSVEQIRGKSRAQYISKVRKQAYRELRSAGYSLTEIAVACGRKDHTTVLNAVRGMR